MGEDVDKRVRPSGSVRPRMYGLPKIHKAEPIPLRPILSLAGSAQHELARWLAEQHFLATGQKNIRRKEKEASVINQLHSSFHCHQRIPVYGCI